MKKIKKQRRKGKATKQETRTATMYGGSLVWYFPPPKDGIFHRIGRFIRDAFTIDRTKAG